MRDERRLKDIAGRHYLTVISRMHGAQGVEAVRRIYPRLREIFEVIDYESITGSLSVIQMLASVSEPFVEDARYEISDISDIAIHNSGTLTLQLAGEKVFLWKRHTEPRELPDGAVTYRYTSSEGEMFWIDKETSADPELLGYPRLFGTRQFLDLSEALADYANHFARFSECLELRKAWREDARVMWISAPESTMRRSLHQYLRMSLRDGRPDVKEEVPPDGENPIDIVIRWPASNRVAVIEIKWLGKSGRLDPPRVTKEHGQARAQHGLDQLIAYLDLTKASSPYYSLRGYLVVFDARRRNVKAATTFCTREDGLHFQDAHIDFDENILRRNDVATPVRFFCEPNFVTASPSHA